MPKNNVINFQIKDYLPRGTAQKIFEELKGKVTLRTIQRILKANLFGDEHGIMEAALRIAKENQKKVQKQKATVRELSGSITKSK